jgi:lysozyme
VTDPQKTSPAGVAFICGWEGFVDHKYNDRAGIPTVGFGHVVQPGEVFTSMTRDQGLALMARDLVRFEAGVNRDVLVPLTQCQFDALVSFCYNAGVGALERSTALHLLNQGDYTAGAEALKMWDKRADPHTGQEVVDAGLLARRAREVILFESDGNAAASDNPYNLPAG